MIDLGKIGDVVGGLQEHVGGAQSLQEAAIQAAVEKFGIDPAILDGLTVDEVTQMLADRGIDLSSLPVEQVQQFAGEGGLLQQIGGWLGLGG
jgi:phage terminase large subunit-like protein